MLILAASAERFADSFWHAAGMVCGGTAVLLRSPVAGLPSELGELLASATPLALVCPADAIRMRRPPQKEIAA